VDFEGDALPSVYPLPSPTFSSSGYQSSTLHLQWRDRAGITPDFPVMPFAGTQDIYSVVGIVLSVRPRRLSSEARSCTKRGRAAADTRCDAALRGRAQARPSVPAFVRTDGRRKRRNDDSLMMRWDRRTIGVSLWL